MAGQNSAPFLISLILGRQTMGNQRMAYGVWVKKYQGNCL